MLAAAWTAAGRMQQSASDGLWRHHLAGPERERRLQDVCRRRICRRASTSTALKWEANKQTFYFDGKEVFSQEVTMGDPMYLMLDLWYGSASGQGDDSTPQGKDNSYEVNYVRAWQFK
jgi:hypothetical protein